MLFEKGHYLTSFFLALIAVIVIYSSLPIHRRLQILLFVSSSSFHILILLKVSVLYC